jgi:hypothetical protein
VPVATGTTDVTWLLATTGLPYSGKSTFARALAEHTGSRVIELDVLNSVRGLDVAHGASIREWRKMFAEASAPAAGELSRGRSVVIGIRSVPAPAPAIVVDGGSWRLHAERPSACVVRGRG